MSNIKSYTHYNEASIKQTEEYKKMTGQVTEAQTITERQTRINSFLNYNKEKNQIVYSDNKYEVVHANKDEAEFKLETRGVHLNTVFGRIQKQ